MGHHAFSRQGSGTMKRREFLKGLGLFISAMYVGGWNLDRVQADGKDYFRFVVVSDAHLPVKTNKHPGKSEQERIIKRKIATIDEIGSWTDVGAVVLTGDIVAETAVQKEYDFIKSYFDRIRQPIIPVTGNHEFRYLDEKSSAGKLVVSTPEIQRVKLEKFKSFWGLSSLWYSKDIGGWHMVFLSTEGPLPVELGTEQLEWFKTDLKMNADKPTVVFFHGPLMDTLLSYKKKINTPRTAAMPADEIERILGENRQVRLWISGHTHTPPTNESFADNDINAFNGHVTDIHNTDLDRDRNWTNSFYVYKDHIDVRTWDHLEHKWITQFDRTFKA